ncbi:MAG: stage II sporulation protein R [Ruminococcaceae bacterium]|nr:stage II sporulation protein R [Oscillospiraceae bacterium]
MTKSKRWIVALSGGLALCLLCSILGIYGQAQGVRDSVVRLHILANSDSTADQTLKLQVRDALTAASAGWLDGATNREDALSLAKQNLPRLQAVAEQTVAAAGADYPVTVQLKELYFTTRQYDTVTLPAGMYDAVQVTLGAGKGQNWWCVVFPPFCAGAATQPERFLSPGQQDYVENEPRYRVRFKVVEWLESFCQLFR